MNIYDPMDHMVYRHVDCRGTVASAPVTSTSSDDRLPAGYPNDSPRTYLGRNCRTAAA